MTVLIDEVDAHEYLISDTISYELTWMEPYSRKIITADAMWISSRQKDVREYIHQIRSKP